MYCSKCGLNIQDGTKFCPRCGAQITNRAPSNEEGSMRIDRISERKNTGTVSIYGKDHKKDIKEAQKMLCLKPGTVLNGRYTIDKVIGGGGFGITYVGKSNALDMKVAVKEFFPNSLVTRNNTVSADVKCIDDSDLFEEEKKKVIREARILAKFAKNPGVVQVLDCFEENNTAYIVMEFIEGGTLKETVMKNGIMTPDYVFSILTPIMDVIGKLHSENVIHRDISPENIMFDGDRPKLLDFGAARELLGNTGNGISVILKHGYAPQEQYSRKGKQGPWTDLYSLCATIYYCITGRVPDSVFDRIQGYELKKPSELGITISPAKEEALMKGLSLLASDRQQSIAEFIDDWKKDQPFSPAASVYTPEPEFEPEPEPEPEPESDPEPEYEIEEDDKAFDFEEEETEYEDDGEFEPEKDSGYEEEPEPEPENYTGYESRLNYNPVQNRTPVINSAPDNMQENNGFRNVKEAEKEQTQKSAQPEKNAEQPENQNKQGKSKGTGAITVALLLLIIILASIAIASLYYLGFAR